MKRTFLILLALALALLPLACNNAQPETVTMQLQRSDFLLRGFAGKRQKQQKKRQ